MRRTRKSLAYLVGCIGILTSLVLVFSQPVASKESETTPKVKELQKKRLAVLQSMYDLAKTGHANGAITEKQVRAAKVDLLSARLDYAEMKKERLQICDEAVADAKDWQKLVQAGAKALVFDRLEELKAESDVLDAQITRENTANEDE